MNLDFEERLWSIGEQESIFSQETWLALIDDLLNDFQKFIGEEFERETGVYLSAETVRSRNVEMMLLMRSSEVMKSNSGVLNSLNCSTQEFR